MTTHTVTTTHTARTPHRCDTCYRRIQPGETYTRTAHLTGGTVHTVRTCQHCCVCWDHYQQTQPYDEAYPEHLYEWLDDTHPDLYVALHGHWEDSTGQLLAPDTVGQLLQETRQ